MKFKYLGTAAAEGIPALFCKCERCKKARLTGGKNIRSRTQAIIDSSLIIDWPPDAFMHMAQNGIDYTDIESVIITHIHEDHYYPQDFGNRRKWFAMLDDDTPQLNVYGSEDLFDQFMINVEKHQRQFPKDIPNTVNLKIVPPYETFKASGFDITPLPAYHGTDHPYIYLIEKDGRAMIYGHDTDIFYDEVFDFLAKRGTKLNFVSLDCTMGTRTFKYHGHMSLERNVEVKNRLIAQGNADESTLFVVNHFSHNGYDIIYDDMKAAAEKVGFDVSYDGMEIEF